MTVSGGHWISLTPGGHQRAFKEDAHKKGKGGYLSIGGRWYRKPLTLPAIPKGLDLWIESDGVYMNSDVRINGHHLGSHPHGYISFYYFDYSLTSFISKGENIIAVHVNNSVQSNSRWHSGSASIATSGGTARARSMSPSGGLTSPLHKRVMGRALAPL